MQFGRLKRREFITLLGGAAAAGPLAARAQPQGRVTTIGLLGSATAATQSQWTAVFVQRLRELGWAEGRNLAIEYRWSDGYTERLASLATDLVRLKVDLIVTSSTPAILAAKQATSVIPIVFATAGNPVGAGIVASLARPGGNVTGLSSQTSETAGKRVDLLRDLIPGLRRLATLVDVDNPLTDLDTGEVQRAARSVGLDVATFEIRRAEDIAPAFDALQGRAQALYVIAVPILFANRIRINVFAAAARLPTMWTQQEAVEAGGLLSYGPNWQSRWRRAADLVDKILRGASPGDIPVEQPTKFDLVINLSTAKALGLKVPESFVLRADEVIE